MIKISTPAVLGRFPLHSSLLKISGYAVTAVFMSKNYATYAPSLVVYT